MPSSMKLHHLLPLIALLLVGCGAKDQGATGPEASSTPPPAKKVLKVALLTPGQVNDAGWSALAYDGLQAIHTELGADVSNDVATDAKIKDAMRTYAQKDYDLIFGHGFEYNKPGVELAKDFPKTVFVSSSGGETAPNAGAFRFYLEQGCYLAGYVAGKMTKTGVIGSVAVQNFPSIVSTLKAYEDGARAANPKITIIPTVYFVNEGDVAKAKQATEAVLARHADFIIHQANDAATGVFQACKEGHAFAFGTNANQNDNDSGIVLASAVIVAKPAFLDLAKQVQAGTYKGQVALYGMNKGAIDFVFNPKLASQVPADVVKSIDDLKSKIKSGALVVPKDNF
jgi:basic membrane protein A